MQKIPHCEAAYHQLPIPREPARRAETHRTVSAADGRGIIPPPSQPPPSADLLLKLYLDRWHSRTQCGTDLVCSRLLCLPAAAAGPHSRFYLSFPAILTCLSCPAPSLPPTLTGSFVWLEQADSINTCKCFNAITVCSYWSAINAIQK